MPVQTVPVIAPATPARIEPEADPWTRRYTDPLRICPQQKRELGSPDLEP